MNVDVELQKLLSLTALKRQLEGEIKKIDEQIKDGAEDLIGAIGRGVIAPPFHVSLGNLRGTISIRTDTYWGSVEKKWPELKKALSDVGWDELIRPQTAALTSRLNEYVKEGLPIPPEVLANVSKREQRSLIVTKIRLGEDAEQGHLFPE